MAEATFFTPDPIRHWGPEPFHRVLCKSRAGGWDLALEAAKRFYLSFSIRFYLFLGK